jgi:hypothetical protein
LFTICYLLFGNFQHTHAFFITGMLLENSGSGLTLFSILSTWLWCVHFRGSWSRRPTQKHSIWIALVAALVSTPTQSLTLLVQPGMRLVVLHLLSRCIYYFLARCRRGGGQWGSSGA